MDCGQHKRLFCLRKKKHHKFDLLDQWFSSRHICCMLCSCLAGLEGDRSAAHRQTGWSLHAGAGSSRSRTHRWQLFASTDHPLQRNAPAWVLKAQTQNLILTNYESIFSVLTGSKMPFRVCLVLIYRLTWTTNPKTPILCIFFFSLSFYSRVSDQALWSCSPESSNERGVPLSPLHGLRPGRRVQENATGFVCVLSDVVSLYILFKK